MATVTSPRSATAVRLPDLRFGPMPQDVLEMGWPSLWWVGCHGGAGVSTLAKLTGMGAEMPYPLWPQVPADWRIQPVVLVARGSAAGVLAACGAVEQWRRRAVPNVQVLGLVVVAASPKRPPKIVAERLRLLSGWLPTTIWRVGWVDTLLAADNPLDVGVPPDVETVRHGLDRILTYKTEAGTP